MTRQCDMLSHFVVFAAPRLASPRRKNEIMTPLPHGHGEAEIPLLKLPGGEVGL